MAVTQALAQTEGSKGGGAADEFSLPWAGGCALFSNMLGDLGVRAYCQGERECLLAVPDLRMR